MTRVAAALIVMLAVGCGPEAARVVRPTPTLAAASPTGAASAPTQPTVAASVTVRPAPSGPPQPTLVVRTTPLPSAVAASLPAMPAQPALATDVRKVASNTVAFAIVAGGSGHFEPQFFLSDIGASPVPNAAVAWTVAWRATDSLTSAVYRQGSVSDIGRGRWGTAEIGGAGFELRNDTSATVFGELTYLIGSR